MARKKSKKKGTKSNKKTLERLPSDWLPRHTLEEAKRVAAVLYNIFAGQPTNASAIAKALTLSAKSNQFRQLMSSALAYGIITKQKSTFALSEIGRKIVAPAFDNEAEEGLRKAALNPLIPAVIYSEYNGHALPPEEHFPSILEERYEIPRNRIPSAIRVILANSLFAGIVQRASANDQHVVNVTGEKGTSTASQDFEGHTPKMTAESHGGIDWSKICFYITPIGDEGSKIRKHADMMLASLLAPVLKDFDLEAVRADQIGRPGLINQQIFEYLVLSRLCIADLSFGNANAFYELGVRHVCKLPTIQIIRKEDKIPFDVAQGRTIQIDTSDVYTVVERLESAKRELAEQIRAFKSSNYQGGGKDNPVQIYMPELKVAFPK